MKEAEDYTEFILSQTGHQLLIDKKDENMKTETQVLTCKLTSPALRQRRLTVIYELKKMMINKDALADGYRYHFSGDDAVLDKLLDFIKSERLCCDFFSFGLLVKDGTATLDVTGPEGTREFLDHEVGF